MAVTSGSDCGDHHVELPSVFVQFEICTGAGVQQYHGLQAPGSDPPIDAYAHGSLSTRYKHYTKILRGGVFKLTDDSIPKHTFI